MPAIATLSLTTGEGTRNAVWRDATMEGLSDAVWWRGVSAEGPRDAVVLPERDRATPRDVVFLERDRAESRSWQRIVDYFATIFLRRKFFGDDLASYRNSSISCHNAFTDRLARKFAIKSALNIPPHLTNVTSLHYLVKYQSSKMPHALKDWIHRIAM